MRVGSRPAAQRIIGAATCARSSRGAADPGGLCQTVCPAQQDRCARRGGDLCRTRPSGHALLVAIKRRPAGGARGRAGARADGQAAHPVDESPAQPARRVRRGASPPQGAVGLRRTERAVAAEDAAIPALLRTAPQALLGHIEGLQGAIAALEAQIMATAKTDPVMRRLATIPGVGGLPRPRHRHRHRRGDPSECCYPSVCRAVHHPLSDFHAVPVGRNLRSLSQQSLFEGVAVVLDALQCSSRVIVNEITLGRFLRGHWVPKR